MLKIVLLFTVLAASLFLLSGCGPWGHWNGHDHGHSSSNHDNSHTHHRDCGHSRY